VKLNTAVSGTSEVEYLVKAKGGTIKKVKVNLVVLPEPEVVIIEEILKVEPVITLAPYFEPELEDMSYTISSLDEKFVYQFPGAIDPEGTETFVSIVSGLEDFMEYDKSKR